MQKLPRPFVPCSQTLCIERKGKVATKQGAIHGQSNDTACHVEEPVFVQICASNKVHVLIQ